MAEARRPWAAGSMGGKDEEESLPMLSTYQDGEAKDPDGKASHLDDRTVAKILCGLVILLVMLLALIFWLVYVLRCTNCLIFCCIFVDCRTAFLNPQGIIFRRLRAAIPFPMATSASPISPTYGDSTRLTTLFPRGHLRRFLQIARSPLCKFCPGMEPVILRS